MKKAKKAEYFERKVYFFRIGEFSDFRPHLSGALEKIENLPFNDGGRYQYDQISDSHLLGYPDTLNYPLHFRFGRTRRNQLPDVEEAGKLSGLELSEEAGLIDVSHIVIFPDGHVAAEFNFDGPRISKLGRYLFDKGGNLPSAPAFLPLFERDIEEVVRSLDSVTQFKIRVPPTAAELLRQADENIYIAIQGGEKAGGGKSIELKLVAEPSQSRLKIVAQNVAALISKSPHERERIERASVDGYFHGEKITKPIDLLEDKLVTSR